MASAFSRLGYPLRPLLVRGPHHLHPQVQGLLDLLNCCALPSPLQAQVQIPPSQVLQTWLHGAPSLYLFPVVWGGSSPACPWPTRDGTGGERERVLNTASGFGPSATSSLSVREAPLSGDGHVEPPPHRSLGNAGGPQTALLHWPQHLGTSP